MNAIVSAGEVINEPNAKAFRRTVPFRPGRMAARRRFGETEKKLKIRAVFADAHVDRFHDAVRDKIER